MDIKERLTAIVGKENVLDDPETLKSYSKDYSLTPSCLPFYIAIPKDTFAIQKIVRLANETRIPLIPLSSGIHLHGGTVPSQGGIVIDLTRMNRILEIDSLNRRLRIESGANWGKVTEELEKEDLRVMMPLLPPASRSVIT